MCPLYNFDTPSIAIGILIGARALPISRRAHSRASHTRALHTLARFTYSRTGLWLAKSGSDEPATKSKAKKS